MAIQNVDAIDRYAGINIDNQNGADRHARSYYTRSQDWGFPC